MGFGGLRVGLDDFIGLFELSWFCHSIFMYIHMAAVYIIGQLWKEVRAAALQEYQSVTSLHETMICPFPHLQIKPSWKTQCNYSNAVNHSGYFFPSSPASAYVNFCFDFSNSVHHTSPSISTELVLFFN